MLKILNFLKKYRKRGIFFNNFGRKLIKNVDNYVEKVKKSAFQAIFIKS